MRLQFVLSEVAIGIRRNLMMTVSLVLVTLVSLFLVGFGVLAARQVASMKTYWYDRVQVSIFMCGKDSDAASCADGEVTQAQRDAILTELRSPQLAPYVEKVFYETKQQAYEHFKQQYKDSVLSDNVTVDQMPESYRVRLKNPEQYKVVSQLFTDRPGVEEVQDQNQVLDRLFALLNGAKWTAWVIAGVTLLSSVLLVAVTIRLTAFTRRRETSIMRLVGASNFFIQLPFILESLFAAVLGATLASLLLVGFTQFVIQGWLSTNLQFITWVQTGVAWDIVPLLYLVGIVIAGVSSFLALLRYLKV